LRVMQSLFCLIVGVALGLVAIPLFKSDLRSRSTPVAAQSQMVEYKVYERSDSVAHVLTIPLGSRYQVRSFVSNTLETVAQVGEKKGAIATLNAGFFDPVNQKTTSYVVAKGQEVASPKNNERLTENPKLAPYLEAILNRSEFRIYSCASKVRYDIVPHRDPLLAGCQLTEAMGGGPQLLPIDTGQQEGFIDFAQGIMVRDAIGSVQSNARTVIGLTAKGDLIWVMVAQKSVQSNSSGMTLKSVADFLKGLGVQKALNLDGGTSSSLYYKGKAIYGKRDASGQAISRSVKSMLLLQPSQ
jgi:hypothetical protein